MPSNCTDLLQPIDLSVNKPFKDHLRKCFAEWYSQQVSAELEAGVPIDKITVDTRMSIIKEISAKWLTSAFDYIKSHPNIVINGFVKAGIVNSESLSCHVDTIEDTDPFVSDCKD